MLFAVSWEFIDPSEDGARRSLEVFQNWRPVSGADFKGFYGYADGGGGLALIDVDTAATLARAMAPFTPWMQFTARAILPIGESTQIAAEALDFRDNI